MVSRLFRLVFVVDFYRRQQPESNGFALHRPVDIFVNNVSSFSADIF